MDRRNEPEKEWPTKKEKENEKRMHESVGAACAPPNIDNSKMNKVLAEAAVEYKKRLEELAK